MDSSAAQKVCDSIAIVRIGHQWVDVDIVMRSRQVPRKNAFVHSICLNRWLNDRILIFKTGYNWAQYKGLKRTLSIVFKAKKSSAT